MDNINKAKLIKPLVVLVAAAISSVIMFIRDFEFYRMLWTLFTVMVIFLVIGDIVQYIYLRIRPRVIPEADDIERLLSKVDTSKLQLDEDLLQQYLDVEEEETPDVPEEVLKEAQKLVIDEPDFFDENQGDYQDDMFMDESQGNY